VACVLDLGVDDVPDFVGEEERGGPQWWVAFGSWLASRGLAAVSIHDSISFCLISKGPLVHVASGPGPRGERHAVVGLIEADENEDRWTMVHDPHPSGDGLISAPDRYYFFFPLRSEGL
jgi:hypothetical protein